MEIRRDNLRRWKIEIEMDGLTKPDVAEVYESVRKHFHLKRETYGTHRLDKRWITVNDISTILLKRILTSFISLFRKDLFMNIVL